MQRAQRRQSVMDFKENLEPSTSMVMGSSRPPMHNRTPSTTSLRSEGSAEEPGKTRKKTWFASPFGGKEEAAGHGELRRPASTSRLRKSRSALFGGGKETEQAAEHVEVRGLDGRPITNIVKKRRSRRGDWGLRRSHSRSNSAEEPVPFEQFWASTWETEQLGTVTPPMPELDAGARSDDQSSRRSSMASNRQSVFFPSAGAPPLPFPSRKSRDSLAPTAHVSFAVPTVEVLDLTEEQEPEEVTEDCYPALSHSFSGLFEDMGTWCEDMQPLAAGLLSRRSSVDSDGEDEVLPHPPRYREPVEGDDDDDDDVAFERDEDVIPAMSPRLSLDLGPSFDLIASTHSDAPLPASATTTSLSVLGMDGERYPILRRQPSIAERRMKAVPALHVQINHTGTQGRAAAAAHPSSHQQDNLSYFSPATPFTPSLPTTNSRTEVHDYFGLGLANVTFPPPAIGVTSHSARTSLSGGGAPASSTFTAHSMSEFAFSPASRRSSFSSNGASSPKSFFSSEEEVDTKRKGLALSTQNLKSPEGELSASTPLTPSTVDKWLASRPSDLDLDLAAAADTSMASSVGTFGMAL